MMMKTKNVAMLMMVMMVIMGMENIMVQAKRDLSPSPYSQDDDDDDSSIFDDVPSPSPSQDDDDDSSFDNGPSPYDHLKGRSKQIQDLELSLKKSPPSDFDFSGGEPALPPVFSLAPGYVYKSPANELFCAYGCAIHYCNELGSEPNEGCVQRCRDVCKS